MCGDPHMQGLRGQQIDWSGIDNSWYCMVSDDTDGINVNVRLNAPLPEDFPDRQLITGLSVMSQGHSLVIVVTNPYDVNTAGCPSDMSICQNSRSGRTRPSQSRSSLPWKLVPTLRRTVTEEVTILNTE